MDLEIIEKFKQYYDCPHKHDPAMLDEFYDENFQYIDPVSTVTGRSNYKKYYKRFTRDVIDIGLRFTRQSILNDKAFLEWECEVYLKKVNKRVQVSGISVLIVTNKIIWQRNYFDGGAFLYEPLPVIGRLLKWIKKKVTMP
jgi:limonene-1,2-epoxide hydrolase